MLAALIVLSSGPAVAKDKGGGVPPAPIHVTGPAADYPVTVGDPFTIGSTVWTPTDQMNYDAVGKADVGTDGSLAGVSAAHKTLPIPSYAEVTSLDTGRTILLRIVKRGPMLNDVLTELSPLAAQQLGVAPGSNAPVRVRRVNPPEQERALLRSGGSAPERIETPEGLLKVLRRKLADQSPLLPPPSIPPAMPTGVPAEALAQMSVNRPPIRPEGGAREPSPISAPVAPPTPKAAQPKPILKPTPKPVAPKAAPSAAPARVGEPAARRGAAIVQVGAFSLEANARGLAAKLGGKVTKSGAFWRVYLGPYGNRDSAAGALEKAKRAGYKDARIQNVN
ncbi:sporulation-like protein [Novosphingobium sp. Rr 2-17]|nr:sporulation-like protein [Novosphingobium sp. Rr 2-17]